MQTGDRNAFAKLLRRRRIDAGLTQQELAERAGISVRAISDLERRVNLRPRRDTANMLASGLGLAGAEREVFLATARSRPRLATTSAAALRAALPKPASPLFGRETEIRAISAALMDEGARLLTLTGPGGVGKTRLALEVAHEVASRFAGGVLFLQLDGLNDPTLVLPTIAGALELLEIGGELTVLERVAAHLQSQDILIVLDNLEHLLPAAIELSDLLGRVPQARMLVTSRESLRVEGERVFAIAPLTPPDQMTWQTTDPIASSLSSPAVRLFMEHVWAARPDLVINSMSAAGGENLDAISEICRRLDGLPLAIELAAAQAQVLSPLAILMLLKNAGLPLLASGRRDRPIRLQTMDAAIEWSYALLPADEQALFRALSVFAGGFTLAAAAAVAGSSDTEAMTAFDPQDPLADVNPSMIGAISSLARKHLIFEDTRGSNDTVPRFRMLEPIRLFALDRLRAAGDEPGVRLRHATFFVGLAEALDVLTLGPNPDVWLQQQIIELNNFRSALDWTRAAGKDELLVRITCAVAQLWELRGWVSEAQQRIAQALAVDAGSPPETRWFLRFWAATFALDQGDIAGAAAHARELLTIAQAHDDLVGTGVGMAALSRAIGSRPDSHEEAADLARRAAETLEPLAQDEWTGWAWTRLGIEEHLLGRLDAARDRILRGLDARRRRACEGCVAYSLASLAAVALDLNDVVMALESYRESLALAIKHENQTLLLAVLLGLADVARRCRDGPESENRALLVFGAAEAQRRRHGLGWSEAARDAIARWQAPMRADAGDELVDALIDQGMTYTLDEVETLVDGLCTSGQVREFERTPGISLMVAAGSIE